MSHLRIRFFAHLVTAAAFGCLAAGTGDALADSPTLIIQPNTWGRPRLAQATQPNPSPPGSITSSPSASSQGTGTPQGTSVPQGSSTPQGVSTPQGSSTPQGVSTPQSASPAQQNTPNFVPGTAPTFVVPTVPVVPGYVPAQVGPTITSPPILPPAPTMMGPQVDFNAVQPAAPVAVPPATGTSAAPLLDESVSTDSTGATTEDLPEGLSEELRRGVQPYGGGHPDDWSWGCGGSPYRSHGQCDNWKVGCCWAVTVDGLVMTREKTDLSALDAQMFENDPTAMFVTDNNVPLRLIPAWEQFDHGPGARITFMSQVPQYVGYQVQAAYEGIEEWNSSIVYPRLPFELANLPDPGAPPAPPPGPPEYGTEQRSLYYRSSYHSGELNWVRACDPVWRPFCGVRYIKFDDEIQDVIDQEAPPPLPGSITNPPALGDPLREDPVLITDRVNLFDIENNLIGFQLGLMHDTWRINRRFAIEGFASAGVYYNKVKYTNHLAVYRTQFIADNFDTEGIEGREDESNTIHRDVREQSEIAAVGEVSLSGVCRLNKCWAMRAGYQALFINNVHLAEDAFLTSQFPAAGDTDGRSLIFHGWSAGIECRR